MTSRKQRSMAVVTILVALTGAAACGRGTPPTDTPQQVQPAVPPAASRFAVRLETSGPLKRTAAPLDVTVRENGAPATDVSVSIELRMPPSESMGEMRTGAELHPAGEGHYRGQVDMMMAGQWNAIVRVRRNGELVAMHTQPVTAE